jgi:hypothetical protein
MRKLAVFIVVAALGTTIGATAAGAGESGDLKKFCKTNVAIDTASEAPSDSAVERLRTTAPPEIAEVVDTGVTLFQEQGEAAFENEEFLAALQEIDQFVLDNCDYEQVDVTMQEYAFDGIPDQIEKGTVAFNLSNEGSELHEFVVVRLKGDATLDDILELPQDATEEDFGELAAEVPGGGFAAPEGSDLALIKLNKTGNYAAVCFVPVGSTDEAAAEAAGEAGAATHFAEGMAAEFEVTS